MPNPASVGDVQRRFPRLLTTSETTVAGALLDDAWTDLQDAVPDLATRLVTPAAGDPEDLDARARRVLAQAVGRVLRNPFGRRRESRGVDDAQRSWELDASLASGELYFTDAELDLLRAPDDDTHRGKAFTVMPS